MVKASGSVSSSKTGYNSLNKPAGIVVILRYPNVNLIPKNMNFIFFSVHFPSFIKEFSYHLNHFGAKVLGIGDTDYDQLDDRLKSSLTDYYRVGDMENYDEALRATGYFTHKYGRIDRFESLNEHWLELEAQIRTDFNVEGMKAGQAENIRRKTLMKDFFRKSGVRPIPYIDHITRKKVGSLVKSCGYPIIIKPDKGSGAYLTFRIGNEEELDRFFADVPKGIDFIAEEYIDGDILTYDGLIDRNGRVIFESGTVCEKGIMDFVNDDDHAFYIGLPQLNEEVAGAGRRILESCQARERFFHLEFFRSRRDGELFALEINMRPPGAWVTDSINFSHDMDIYREWANMVVNGRIDGPFRGKYYTAYASRKNRKQYRHDHDAVLRNLGGALVKHEAIPAVFSRAMGNYAYMFRGTTLEEVKSMIAFVHEEVL